MDVCDECDEPHRPRHFQPLELPGPGRLAVQDLPRPAEVIQR